MNEFNYMSLPKPIRARIRHSMINHNIEYIKAEGNRKKGNDITSEHILQLIDKCKDSKHYSTVQMVKFLRSLL